MTTRETVNEHLKSSRELEKKLRGSKAFARRFLIRAGILDKSGKKLARRFRD